MKNPFSCKPLGTFSRNGHTSSWQKGRRARLTPMRWKDVSKAVVLSNESRRRPKSPWSPRLSAELCWKRQSTTGRSTCSDWLKLKILGKWQLLMFQETVGQKHREAQWNDIKSIVGACQQIAEEKKKELECLLIYLVPKDSYAHFNAPNARLWRTIISPSRRDASILKCQMSLLAWRLGKRLSRSLGTNWEVPAVTPCVEKGSCNLQLVCWRRTDDCKGLWIC